MSLFIKYITIFLSIFIFSTPTLSKEYLQDTTDIDRLKLWEELRDSILIYLYQRYLEDIL